MGRRIFMCGGWPLVLPFGGIHWYPHCDAPSDHRVHPSSPRRESGQGSSHEFLAGRHFGIAGIHYGLDGIFVIAGLHYATSDRTLWMLGPGDFVDVRPLSGFPEFVIRRQGD